MKKFIGLFNGEYKWFALSTLTVGVAVSSSMPLVTLYLVRDFGLPNTTVGFFFLTMLTGPVVGLAIGRASDRISSRLPLLIASAVWSSLGWFTLAIATQFWVVLAVGLVFFSTLASVNAQIFAALGETMEGNEEEHQSAVNSSVRAAYSMGYMLGPVLGTWIAQAVGLRFSFATTGCLYMVCLLPLLGISFGSRNHEAEHHTPAAGRFGRENVYLLIFGVTITLLSSGDAIKLAYLPLYVLNTLHQNMVLFGSLLTVQAIVEVVVMPIAGLLADRWGVRTVLSVGLMLGISDYALLANSQTIWQLYVAQLLHACLLAAVLGVGLTLAQQLSPLRLGLANSVFFGAQILSSPVGGAIGSFGVSWLGNPAVFYLPASFCLLALVQLTAYTVFTRDRALS